MNYSLTAFLVVIITWLIAIEAHCVVGLYIHLYSSNDSHERNITNNDK